MMKAFAHTEAVALTADQPLIELEAPMPEPGAHDLLVEVRAVSMNPVDVKVRELMAPEGPHRILGWDAAGVVKAVGADVTRFKPGDEVFYAGEFTRPGSNADFQLVDERITGRKPSTLNYAQSAALPLTSITAWEILFDCFGLKPAEQISADHKDGSGDALLIIGAAGGVGSIMIQLAKKLTGLTVIATASRPDTEEWVKKMGADHVINHRNPLNKEMEELGITPRYVASLTHTDQHFAAIVDLIQPRGHLALIDDPQNLDISPIKLKALSLSWEFMFTRPLFQTADMDVQHQLLNRVADLVDAGELQTTMNHHAGEMTLANLLNAHKLQETGTAIGKTVLELA